MSTDNSTIVISIKGTSAGWIVGGGGPTVQKDKLNDNLLFSCCCARVGPTWSTVCDCFSGGYRCDQTCVEKALIEDSLFYPIGMVKYFTSIVDSAHISHSELILQRELYVSGREHLDCGSFAWRCPCIPCRCDIRHTCRGLRGSRRKESRSETASPIAGKLLRVNLFHMLR